MITAGIILAAATQQIVTLQRRLILIKQKPKPDTMQGQQEDMGMGSMMREVQELAEKFKVEEDEQYISPYAHLEKAQVLQEAR